MSLNLVDIANQNKNMMILANAANLLNHKNKTFNGKIDSKILSLRKEDV